ncbi:UDP-N-acetylglucosamine-N-acetylmuramyl-(pentapeptide(pyrophosphoryl-undecaprenol N-acetylglucosamine transferase [[Clostridium] sordellii]|uniref:UDP-N-acetylglucosamine--N-acetylmuramyl-(pentapeptide) pyrophosphoryl-undecaprenol N-acetylglucosamine transferase n=2 Tax=Paraclostridium sordellii TaxID=1505 RepID=A0ABM9RS30_PARSO|nr:undecaprenyldiphospho-muramoylpentapeptide beta-N-acetylglucosaminyltransferase [Paeniclostridium sordellii]CEJ74863.1 UDP-N-acetylglucosamine--N-acetylmuramyl-(pentapeptide) pyrophosphoryl-undecaprenol N-acetylglucosamine transferase [[Clostridium] sordellii] [Paeniclostridium sordellii]CEN70436.1 UDP-N-acetylglucosamine-N-acetylmuramyl-(pentapeptide) pyrophosphoryl-undecaprenol N-acetylglucosamine transferase [[Clostridium] sordellii] [Paeniclostridium sordellii]CEN73726.1 UDP-N-acetylgluco
MKILLSGGGTGGHVYPAIAIANKIKEENPEAEIIFVGTEKGIESEIVPKYGYELKTVTVQGFKRKIDFENVKRVFKLFKGLEQSRKIVKKFKPDVVIGTGGYVSGPVLFNSSMSKVPTIVHEQNSFPGVTNKILAKMVTKVLTSFEDSHERFPEETRSKLVLTGNPVRKEILISKKSVSRRKLGIQEDKKMVLCYGGSGGSRKINDSMKLVIRNLVNDDIAFIYATGKNFYDGFINDINDLDLKPYQKVVPYLEDMATALAACDIVIGSAGAISLAEITALGKPSIIIPKAYTAENHQEYNAKSVESKGAGIAILEKNLTPETLNETVYKLLGDRDLLLDMSNASKEIGKPEAIDIIYKEVMEVYNRNNKKSKSLSDEQVKKIDTQENEEKQVKTIGIKNKK